MARRIEHLLRSATLDDAAEIHHCDIVRQVLNHGKIVSNEQVGDTELFLQILQQIQNLGLYRHIKRRSRFIADHQFRLHGQGAGDGYTLALPPGELMRIAPGRFIGQTYLLEQRDDCRPLCRTIVRKTEGGHAFGDDLTNPQTRIERSKRILKNHLQMAPAPYATTRLSMLFRAVTIMIGVRLNSRFSRSNLHNLKPSNSGIIKSSRNTSGLTSLAF